MATSYKHTPNTKGDQLLCINNPYLIVCECLSNSWQRVIISKAERHALVSHSWWPMVPPLRRGKKHQHIGNAKGQLTILWNHYPGFMN